MSSSRSYFHSEPPKIEQIITEFFAKSLQIILESRLPSVSSRNFSGEQTASSLSSSSSSSSVRPRDKWFNLALRESPTALENLDIWRQSDLEPLIVDVVLVEWPTSSPLLPHSPVSRRNLFRNLSIRDRVHDCWSPGQEDFLSEAKSEKIIERWVLQYENRKGSAITRDSNSGTKKSGGASCQSTEVLAAYSKTYKKSIILLRSLYVTVRLLPAYNLFRDLNSSGQIHPFSLSYKVSSFVEPFNRREEAEMQQFTFVPVDTCCGRLCLSVVYRPTTSDVKSESSTPMSPQIITDYVGSPTTDPLRRFPSLPLAGLMSRTPGSSSSLPFARRHSWSNDLHMAAPSFSSSPSPTYSDSHMLPSNLNSHRRPPRILNMDMSPPVDLPHPPPETPSPSNVSLIHKKNTSFDEYWSSPLFSPSPTPSPPTNIPGNHLSNARLWSESAPVSIPSGRLGRGLPPSASPKGTKPRYSSQSDNLRTQVSQASSQASLCRNSLLERKCKKRQDLLRPKEFQTGGVTQKAISSGKDEVGNTFEGARISSSSPQQISYSRSFCRSPFKDEFDDSELACPFAVDDGDDLIGLVNRTQSFDGIGHIGEGLESGAMLYIRKSQDAAVGALVHMLKSAPPLRQDCSNSANFYEASKPESQMQTSEASNATDYGVSVSGLLMSRTTADALEELKGYREMKDHLLKQGALKPCDQRRLQG
ncbi:autophagy-related protein 13b-like [Aristolochia californica]|uniref:autophagy-related protein 13b-like n=1 Tax=Aristolochia californica TaxID=171875 RepID=UPI0035DC4841